MTIQTGVTTGINPGCGNPGSKYAFWPQLAADYRRLGLSRLRFQLPWCSIELSQGSYNWTVLDDIVSNANALGMPLCYTIANGIPSWALTNVAQKCTTEPFFAPDPTLTAGFAQQVINRYKNQIQFFEIGNETFNIHNTSPSGGFSGIHNSTYVGLYGNGGAVTLLNKVQPGRDPFFYESVAAACYPILKSYGARVGMAAMWWTQPANPGGVPNTTISNYAAFLSQLFTDGSLPQYADYLNLHYYSNATDPSVGSNQCIIFAQALADVQSVLQANQSNLKLRITEFGWQIPQDAPNAATQYNWYSYVLSQMAANPGLIEGWDFFTLNYNVNGPSSSLVTANIDGSFTYQPAYSLVQHFSQQQQQPPQQQFSPTDIHAHVQGLQPSGGVPMRVRRPSLLQELIWGIEDFLQNL